MNWLITIHILLLKLRSPYNGTPAQGNRRRFSKRVIGKNGDLPWNLPGDLKWFRKITMGQIILMGRKTLGILGALAGRQNWVLSNSLTGNQDIRVFKSIEEAINAAEGKASSSSEVSKYTGNL